MSSLTELEKKLRFGKEYSKVNAIYSDYNEKLRFERWMKKNSSSPRYSMNAVGMLMWWRTNVDCYRPVREPVSSDSRENAIARELGFRDDKQRDRYNKYCKTMNISIHNNRKRYLGGIEDWLRNVEGTGYVGIVSTFGSVRDYGNFREWCERNGIDLSLKQMQGYISTYKRINTAKKKMKEIVWESQQQMTRYTNYCYSLGFRPYMDPVRYVEGIEYWRKVIDVK